LELATRLVNQIRYFGSRADALSEWREAASLKDPCDIWRIWNTLPILSKQDLKNRFDPSEMKVRFNLNGVGSTTGGSTGEPTPYFHDETMIRVATAARLYSRRRMGWHPGMPTICLWGSERDIGKLSGSFRSRISCYLTNYRIIDGYGLNDRTVSRLLELINRHGSVAIYGFTSMLEFVARKVLEAGNLPEKGRVQTAWNGGEMLFDTQRDLFRKAFGVPILNYYGGRELSAMAYEPRAGASLRVLRPFVFLEIVDEQGKPVRPGVTGRLIWTSTVCRGTPFLRYDIGDVGSYDANDYDESGISGIKELQGRYAGLLKLSNGKTISCLFWNHFFKDFPEVEQFQVVLLEDGDIRLRLKGSPFAAQRESELRSVLQKFIGDIPIKISWLEKIPTTSQGKLVQVVREKREALTC
jgi:phenylacetate-CoA ligase